MITRVRRGWSALASEQRLAAACALGLFVTMFLPWYTRDTTAVVRGRLQTVDSTLMAWKAFSFVEAAILLVAVFVLILLFARAERRAFHLPGGDGLVVTAAGAWVALLVFYRLLDNKTGAASEFQKVDYGVSWGIFVTLLCGGALAYAGQRLRAAHLAEPPLDPAVAGPAPATTTATAPVPADAAPTTTSAVDDRRARREERERARERATAPTAVRPRDESDADDAPREGGRPEIDGGTQLSFDEQD